MMVIQ